MFLILFCLSWSTSHSQPFTQWIQTNTQNTRNPPNWISLERDISWFWVNFFYLLFKRVTRKPYHLSKAFVSMTSPFFVVFSAFRSTSQTDVTMLMLIFSPFESLSNFQKKLHFSELRNEVEVEKWVARLESSVWCWASLGFLSNRAQISKLPALFWIEVNERDVKEKTKLISSR